MHAVFVSQITINARIWPANFWFTITYPLFPFDILFLLFTNKCIAQVVRGNIFIHRLRSAFRLTVFSRFMLASTTCTSCQYLE